MSLTVDAEDPETTLLGKQVSDLQSGIVINDTSIKGTLKYVTGYTGYSGDPDLQKGNFMALKANAPDGATVTVEVIGGESGPVTLDSDMNVVIRVANNAQKIKFTSTLNGVTVTNTYSLAGLKLKEA